MKPTLEAATLHTISRHIRKLALISDDLAAVQLLLDCSDRLADRADHIQHEKEKTNHEARQP